MFHRVFITPFQLAAQREKESVILEHLKHANFKQLLDNWLESMLSHASPVALHGLHMAAGHMDSYVDIPDFICNLLRPVFGPQFCPCMAEFSEVDFEDGVKWLKCFYNCE